MRDYFKQRHVRRIQSRPRLNPTQNLQFCTSIHFTYGLMVWQIMTFVTYHPLISTNWHLSIPFVELVQRALWDISESSIRNHCFLALEKSVRLWLHMA